MRIVIIEDNESLARAIAYRLRDRGHAADLLHDGSEAEEFLKREGADLVILDVNLPGLSGLEIIRAMRARDDGTPVLMLSARGETDDRIQGLDAGADDYLAKPFEMDELEARVRALSRRRNLDYGVIDRIGPLSFDRAARVLRDGDAPVEIPRRELAVLECLLENRNRLSSKAKLTEHVYGVGADVDDTAIEPHISRLRRRLSAYGIGIKTARGLGYILDVQ